MARKSKEELKHIEVQSRDMGATVESRLHQALAERQRERRVGGKKEQVNFTCRVCGGKEYSEINGPGNGVIGPGGSRGEIVGYECDNCSVRFGDPKNFTTTSK